MSEGLVSFFKCGIFLHFAVSRSFGFSFCPKDGAAIYASIESLFIKTSEPISNLTNPRLQTAKH